MTDKEIFDINGLSLCVSKTHRFGTDAVKLAEFTAKGLHKSKIIADLCTGCGIIPFLLLDKAPAKIYAVDIDAEAIGLLRESVEINKLGEKIIPVHEDLKHITQIGAGSADIVTVNPPYYRENDGFKRESGKTARHELLCGLDDVIKAASRLLKFGGRLKMCHIPERLADVICALREHNLEPKNVQFLANNKTEPWLVLFDAKKGGKPNVKIQLTID